MPSPVESIKERLSIADVVGSYIKLEKAGANFKAKCPFHNEKTPSFFISPVRNSYYCFGCGAKGDIFSFVQAFEGSDFVGALRTLAARAGVELVREDPRVRSERERLFSLLEIATTFFEEKLQADSVAREYLAKRGLSAESIRSWRVGFAPDAWDSCLTYCTQKGYTRSELEKVGLIKSENGKTFDRFRSRIMFPIFDASGRPIAFSGRILGKESDHIPKYLNSPETTLFSKSRILYGFDRAKLEIRRKDFAMLVEGQMDLLMCHQAGFINAVASSGTAFTPEQLTLLKRLSKRLLMVYDADKAGVQASLRSYSLVALAGGMEVKVAALPLGSDPAEMILNNLPEWKKCLKNSMHIIDFYLAQIVREHTDERSLARAVHDRLLPFVVALESSIERDRFVLQIATQTSIHEKAIREDLQTLLNKTPSRSEEQVQVGQLSPRQHLVERLLIGLVLWQEKLPKPLVDVVALRADIKRVLANRADDLFGEAKAIADELVYQAEAYYEGNTTLTNACADLVAVLEEDTLKDSLTEAMKKLTEAEKKKDEKLKRELLGLCQEITGRLNSLKGKRHDLRS
ncbi:MAG: DNA primase [Candidatus Taylorbacteria bacterium RIFCSPHIGHO2_01_FULL_46_22b]|uniref:DNA primase n=1 Tax=Candidatus Taylorbacteria bacterium RIFCSPHIGHO2_01_FULL_46_22b TaxID=1802301 RepID=A0A1G2M480_9BACT|nr:MAG: DNA primase [Candidatus Taylorbacteria bacterium RIFCSPHIGHO2_01_FULL_46_22b]